jgi:predicted transcriptional regulator
MDDCLAIQDKKEETFLYRIFISHPELNASAVARRMGISQSLMSQYISGIKKPSQERETLIVNTIKDIGKELMMIV